MRRIASTGLAVFAFLALSQLSPANAADMAVKAPPAAPIASDPWTGAYVGGTLGGLWSDARWTSGGAIAGGPNNPASLRNGGIRAGGYVGYNVKVAPLWVAGLEGDLAYARLSMTVSPFPGTPNPPVGGGPTDRDTVKLGWDASIRGRFGVLIKPTVLLYGTGGVAWQEITTNSTCTIGGFCVGSFTSGNVTTAKAGWTLGAGIEAALTNHWFVRAEYRFSDFGHVNNVLPPSPFVSVPSTISVKTNIADAGLAYKF